MIAAQPMGGETAVLPQVAQRGLWPFIAADQEIAAHGNHADHGQELDDGKPEFGLAEYFDVCQVDCIDQHEEDCGRYPGRNLWPPVVHVFADGYQFGHANQDVQHPAAPSRQETGKPAPVLVGEVAERAGHGFFNDHFTQLPHDHEGDEAANRVAKDH